MKEMDKQWTEMDISRVADLAERCELPGYTATEGPPTASHGHQSRGRLQPLHTRIRWLTTTRPGITWVLQRAGDS